MAFTNHIPAACYYREEESSLAMSSKISWEGNSHLIWEESLVYVFSRAFVSKAEVLNRLVYVFR